MNAFGWEAVTSSGTKAGRRRKGWPGNPCTPMVGRDEI